MRNGKTIPVRKVLAVLLAVPFVFLVGLPYAQAVEGVEDSYHGQLGRSLDDGWGNGLGMLEKWCALPNFSFSKQGGIGDGTTGWTAQSCNDCHIGAAWNPTKTVADCTRCHESSAGGDVPTIAKCYTCHFKDTAKRGDVFDAENDVHIAAGMLCQNCHEKVTDTDSDHQFLKGTAIDTTEDTMEGTLKCANCHGKRPHRHVVKGGKLNKHCNNVSCETCHTGLRPGNALLSRVWNEFTATGKPVTVKRGTGWLPEHKWYDNTGPQESGDFHLPILSYTERRGLPGAKIYPFNPVAVTWFIETSASHLDDVIIVPDVKAADANGDRTVTVVEMRAYNSGQYPNATLVTKDMNFNVSHSVVPKEEAFNCGDCHGDSGYVLNWEALGYDGDPAERRHDGGMW